MELVHRQDGGGEWAIEARAQGRTAANDANTVFAPGHALASARWSRTLSRDAQGRLELLLRVDNLTDRRHVGSLIVNEANGRFFEPGPPRHVLLALRLLAND
jgi:iron complex outermembrane receptor protein